MKASNNHRQHYAGTGHWFLESDRPESFHPKAAFAASIGREASIAKRYSSKESDSGPRGSRIRGALALAGILYDEPHS
jgi:hypothetical protein